MSDNKKMPAAIATAVAGIKTFTSDITQGFLKTTHNSLMLLGMAVTIAVAILAMKPELRAQSEEKLGNWLTERKVASIGFTPEPQAIERITAINPQELTDEQANVAMWISKKYRVAPEPVSALVAEAYDIGQNTKLDPKLLLAVMAIESRFNPFAQSQVGAQGLMQVMTKIHADKYEHFGGHYAAFDPKSNLKVGAHILQDYVKRAGSIEAGLKWYVGAANLKSDGGYASKVLEEYKRIEQAAKAKTNKKTNTSTQTVKQQAKQEKSKLADNRGIEKQNAEGA